MFFNPCYPEGCIIAKNLQKAILILQVATVLAVFLNIPFFQQIFGFIYLSFVPGALILEILKLDTKSKLGFILISVGVSIAFDMFAGLAVDALLPFFGVSKPLSTFPLMVAIGTILFVLTFVSDRVNRAGEVESFSFPRFSIKRALAALLLFSTPLLAIFGAIYSSTLLLSIMVIVVAALVIISCLTKIVPPQIKPLVVLVIALSILFQIPFLSQHLIGWDIYEEFYAFRSTQINSLWNATLSSPLNEIVAYNGMLSVTVLPTVYSNLLNLNGEFVFRIVYLLFYSLVPLAIYQTYKGSFGTSVAFLSAFYFILFPRFYAEERRQIIGELFFVLIIFLVLNKTISPKKKSLLLIIFAAALAVSHYYIFYIFLSFAIFTWAALTLSKKLPKIRIDPNRLFQPGRLFSSGVMLVILVIGFVWYFYATPTNGNAFLLTAKTLVTGFSSDFTSMQSRGGSVNDFISPNLGTLSLASQVDVIINKIPYVLILIGFIAVVKFRKSLSLNNEYLLMLSACIITFALVFLVPYLAPIFLPQRFFHISLMFLAPVCIFGGLTALELVIKRVKKIKKKTYASLGIICILFVIIFFFKVGIISELTNDAPVNTAISFSRMYTSNDPMMMQSLYSVYSPPEDIDSAIWLSKFAYSNSSIYADEIAQKHVLVAYGMITVDWNHLLSNDTKIGSNSYVYLRFFNVKGLIITNQTATNDICILNQLSSMDKIYSNGKSEISFSGS